MNLKFRKNTHVEKILERSHSGEHNYSLSQIEWKFENKEVVFILWSKPRFWRRSLPVFLVQRSNGSFAILSSQKFRGLPCYLYDIIDIESFLQKYAFTELKADEDGMYEIYDKLQEIKDKPGIGFIETHMEQKTKVYDIA